MTKRPVQVSVAISGAPVRKFSTKLSSGAPVRPKVVLHSSTRQAGGAQPCPDGSKGGQLPPAWFSATTVQFTTFQKAAT